MRPRAGTRRPTPAPISSSPFHRNAAAERACARALNRFKRAPEFPNFSAKRQAGRGRISPTAIRITSSGPRLRRAVKLSAALERPDQVKRAGGGKFDEARAEVERLDCPMRVSAKEGFLHHVFASCRFRNTIGQMNTHTAVALNQHHERCGIPRARVRCRPLAVFHQAVL